MKKNKMMRLASVLLVLVLMTTCVIGGTFAKYTTSATSSDSARVAYWGFQSSNSMDLSDLFAASYSNVKAQNIKDVMAPGTWGSATFAFAYDEDVKANGSDLTMTGPEVAYDFTVTVEATCDEYIKNNKNIVWKLDNNGQTELEWAAFVEAIAELSGAENVEYNAETGVATGTKQYEPGKLPTAFTTEDNTHTIYWEWKFEDKAEANSYTIDGQTMTQDEYDTYMGNMAEMDDVSIKITITATQVD